MTSVHIQHIDYVSIKIVADPSTLMEISDQFTFYANNYKFHPKYKARVWDGKIRLINTLSGVTYAGLAKRIKKFCDRLGYTVTFDDELFYENISEIELRKFIDDIIPSNFDSRDYQFDSILKCIRTGRRTLLSPTSSGKSFMIYVISQWYSPLKSLIIVPTIGLVSQMESDFRKYGYTGIIHKSTDGLSKSNDIKADMVITTWQSLNNGKHKMPPAWYEQFGVVFGDEAHGAKATSLIQILSSLKGCKYRFGTTGTLDDQPLNESTIEGLFGPKYKSTSTIELMNAGYATKLKIKCIVLKYPKEICKQNKDLSYHDEIQFLVDNKERNNFIKNLCLSLDGNTLLFFKKIDHGNILNEIISKEASGKVFYIDGSVDGNRREEIRKAVEEESNCILIASLGTTSTGVSINRLMHMIAAAPSKSKIKVLQAIGRMLRMHVDKDVATLYDIVDDMSYGSKQNYTLKHFIERVKIYDEEQFDYKIYNIGIK